MGAGHYCQGLAFAHDDHFVRPPLAFADADVAAGVEGVGQAGGAEAGFEVAVPVGLPAAVWRGQGRDGGGRGADGGGPGAEAGAQVGRDLGVDVGDGLFKASAAAGAARLALGQKDVVSGGAGQGQANALQDRVTFHAQHGVFDPAAARDGEAENGPMRRPQGPPLAALPKRLVEEMETGHLQERVLERRQAGLEIDVRFHLEPEAEIADEEQGVGLAEAVLLAEVGEEPDLGGLLFAEFLGESPSCAELPQRRKQKRLNQRVPADGVEEEEGEGVLAVAAKGGHGSIRRLVVRGLTLL